MCFLCLYVQRHRGVTKVERHEVVNFAVCSIDYESKRRIQLDDDDDNGNQNILVL